MSVVCLVSGSFAPREGGAERQMREVLSGISACSGVESVAITQAIEGLPRRQTVDGVSVYRVGSGRLLRIAPRLGMLVFLGSATLRVLHMRPSVVLSLQLGAASTAAAVAARTLGIRHVVRLTGGGTQEFRSEPFARAASPIGRRIVELVASNPAAVVVAPARHLIKDMRQAFPHVAFAHRVITNGVPRTREEVAEVIPNTQREGVVYYARGGATLGDNLMLDVARKCPELNFVVIGRHVDGGANVRSLGWVDDVSSVLQRAKVLLNTSRNEGMPNTALQAVAAGCRVVGAENAGLKELAEDHRGFVTMYPYGDAAEAARLLTSAHAAVSPPNAEVVTVDDVLQEWTALVSGAIE